MRARDAERAAHLEGVLAANPAQVVLEFMRGNLTCDGAVEVIKLEVRRGVQIAQREACTLGAGLVDTQSSQSIAERVDHGRLQLCVVRDDEAAAVVQQRGIWRQPRKLRGNQIGFDVAE